MRIVLINPTHMAIGSRIPDDHLPPLGLLSIGGPLLDAGHEVVLVDADLEALDVEQTVDAALEHAPDAVLLGHSGSTSAHPTAAQVAMTLKRRAPNTWFVYGGVFPTYHHREILEEVPAVDVIVRGEGEVTAVALMDALEHGRPLRDVRGLAFREQGRAVTTPDAAMLRDLDEARVGWELIDHERYSYWGGKRAVVVQFSRGCPHKCNYCGQRGFWTRWRHRDPVRFAAELARLHRDHGVEVFNFADENPTSNRRAWRAFLEALIDEGVRPTLVGSTRADDIVRDADILHLYKRAGVERFLLGMENTDEETLRRIKKGGTTTKDREAIRLLREHGILSMATWVVGFADERPADIARGFRQLIEYDPDQIQALYVTPHRWTGFFDQVKDRPVIQPDRRKWDYKHQVLAAKNMKPWQIFTLVKTFELAAQMRPRALARLLYRPDPRLRHATRWYYQMGRRVWFHEVWSFLTRDVHLEDGPTLEQMWGAPQDDEEAPLVIERRPIRLARARRRQDPEIGAKMAAEHPRPEGSAPWPAPGPSTPSAPG